MRSSTARPEPSPKPPIKLAGYYRLHIGETIIVCGCGASLNELRNSKDFITIGVNDVGRRFDPTYLVVLNPRQQFRDDRFRYVEQSRARVIFTQLDLGIQHPNIVRFRLGQRGGVELADPDSLPYTRNSPYVALCLALFMGARRIGLIGVDFTDHHFFGRTGRHPLTGSLEQINQEYLRLAEACRARGVEVVNVSAQSRLMAFRKMSLADFAPVSATEKPSAIVLSGPRIFFVHYRFLSCGEVFTEGLRHAARHLDLTTADAYWNDPQLPAKVRAFRPDLLLVVHGRRFVQRWGQAFRAYNSAVWLVDEPYEVDDTARWSGHFRTVYVNDPATLTRHRDAHYLPVAYDPDMHRPGELTRSYDVGFIGGYNATRERWLLQLLDAGLLSYVVGGPWQSARLKRLCLASNIPAVATADLYRRTKVVINMFRERHHFNRQHIPAGSLNPRIYEALACGALVVSEHRPELATAFPELPAFTTGDEMVAAVRELLDDDDKRQRLLADSRQHLGEHSYAHRLQTVLAISIPGINHGKGDESMNAVTSERPPAQVIPLLPPGWVDGSAAVTASAGGILTLAPPRNGAPGGEWGLASEAALTQVELAFEFKLDPDAAFIAKILHQDRTDPNTNSYHLICAPEQDYLAKHYHIFRRLRIARGRWQSIVLRRTEHSRIELIINHVPIVAVMDNQLQSGFCFLGIGRGRAELRNIRLRDLAGNSRQRTVPARRPSAPVVRPIARAPRLEPLPFSGMPRRNLLYHIWPVKGSMWRWNLEQLKQRIDVFNGRRIVGIVHDTRSEPPEAVMDVLDGHGCTYIVRPNDPAGEAITFPHLLREIACPDPAEVTFYGHAKGVKYDPNVPQPVRRWAEVQYRTTLDNWLEVKQQLQHFALTGPFKMLGRFRTHHNLGDWHYSGTFFWLRNAHVFARDCLDVPRFYGGVEAWPGLYFKQTECGCLFLDQLRQLPYHPAFWTSRADPAFRRWEAGLKGIAPPPNLIEPAPFQNHTTPRLEQKPEELNGWIDRLLQSRVQRLLTIGAMHGGVEWHVARIFRNHGRDIEITTVDLAPAPEADRTFQDAAERFGQRLRLIAGDSSSPSVRAQLNERYDAVFIDGAHSYQGATSDWLLARSLRAPLIGFHDIVDSDWHVHCRCCVSRLWAEIKQVHHTEEVISGGVWGGIGIVRA